MAREHLITGSGPLLDRKGRLREPGYAFHPPFTYSHKHIAASPLRIKDWDYYLVNDDDFAVALTFSDLGYIGLVSASVIDFRHRAYKTTSELVVMPLGRMGLPAVRAHLRHAGYLPALRKLMAVNADFFTRTFCQLVMTRPNAPGPSFSGSIIRSLTSSGYCMMFSISVIFSSPNFVTPKVTFISPFTLL